MKVPLLDLTLQYQQVKDAFLSKMETILESQSFILGPEVIALEEEIAKYCGTSNAVGVSSGTDALLISLMAMDIKPGDIILTTPYTFFATAGAITRVQAIPLFVDIDPETYNICPDHLRKTFDRLSSDEKKRVKGVLPVHLYGQCADMDRIVQFARAHNLFIIEDAAQAIGASYQGKRAGSMGDFGCFSFYPTKNLGAFGDGGIVTVQNDTLYEKLTDLRTHGASTTYMHKIIGGNFRLDAIQAAIVRIKLRFLDQWSDQRKKNADIYRELFEAEGLLEYISLPIEKEGRHIYNQFVIRVLDGRRDALRAHLAEKSVGTNIYYPLPLHLQECFKYLNYKKGDLKVSETAAHQTLALPIYPELTQDQMVWVITQIKDFFLN